MQRYVPAKDRWEDLPPLTRPRAFFALLAAPPSAAAAAAAAAAAGDGAEAGGGGAGAGGMLVAIGGEGAGGRALDSVETLLLPSVSPPSGSCQCYHRDRLAA